MAARHRQHSGEPYLQWLRVGAVAVGLGAAITAGQGVAAAAPSDSPDTASSAASDAGNTDNDVDRGAAVTGVGSPDSSASGSVSEGSTADGPTSAVSAQQNTNTSSEVGNGAEGAAVDDSETTPESDATRAAVRDSDKTSGSASIVSPEATDSPSDKDAADQPSRARQPVDAKRQAARVPRFTQVGSRDGIDIAEAAPSVSSTASAIPAESIETGSPPSPLAAVTTPPAPAVKPVTIAAAPPAAAAEVTLNSIVNDLLSWIGWGSLASGLPLPTVPLPSVVGSMWLVVRQTHYALSPAGASYLTGQAADPAPDAAVAETGQTGSAGVDPAALAALLARPDVDVTLNDDGTVDVIDGTFTDITVTTDAEAARLLNELSPLLGASAGFASPDNITVQRVGQPGSATAETIFRVRDTVGATPVLGSEVILVTDADGTVTGLFNNHDRRLDSIDMSPDARLDDSFEAVVAATSAYLLSAISNPFLWPTLPFIAFSKFDPELVVYSLEPEAPPQLAWQVAIDPFDPLAFLGLTAAPQPGSTYVIDAGGADAGTVLAKSSVYDLFDPAIATATDALGHLRDIDVARVNLLIFNLDFFYDLTRNIGTSNFVGLVLPIKFIEGFFPVFGAIRVFAGIPILPDIPILNVLPGVSAVLGGWNASAVSAQANMALVYDYYKDVLGVTSFDGEGATIDVVVEFNPFGPLFGLLMPFENAYWDPDNQLMAFGDGGNLEAAVDVIAHEYTHAVVSHTVGQGGSVLTGGEPGAMNEAYADILGNLAEGKTDEGQWLIAEDSTLGVLRDMADPGSISTRFGRYPDHYDKRFKGSEDDGGVHLNSTIFSHAAYLMMTDPATADISRETWAAVFYHSLFKLSSDSVFTDGRAAILQTAKETFDFDDDHLDAIKQAFDAVGILAPSS